MKTKCVRGRNSPPRDSTFNGMVPKAVKGGEQRINGFLPHCDTGDTVGISDEKSGG